MAEKKTKSDEPAVEATEADDVVADATTDEVEVTPEAEVSLEAEVSPVEEAPAEVAAEATAETAAEEPAAEAAAGEAAAEETVPEVVAEEAAEPVGPEKAAQKDEAGAAEGATAAPAPQSGPKLKKKRLPRPLRPQKTRPKRAKATERKPIVRLEKPEHERGRSQERLGTVVSAAMDKTVVVKVEVIKSHRKYKKVVRRSVKFHAHDEANAAKVGDVVRIVETRPLSATKRWRLTEIVEVAK